MSSGQVGTEPHDLKVGGPVDSTEQVYIARVADQEFIELLRVGEYVNIVTSRQMGKTSLVYRAMAQLSEQGFRFAYFDLSPLRTEPSPQVYFQGIVKALARKLRLDLDLTEFWARHADESLSLGFIAFFRLALERLDGRIVIVLDEIDSTLERDFTDDLFTAIRSLYTGRPEEPELKRLSFCLVGVATPNELIKARRTTPYNIGRTLWLADFDPERDDLTPLARLLHPDADAANLLLQRILHWTGGQPYLTARLCEEARRHHAATAEAIDALVEQDFKSLEGLHHDAHFEQTLRFINERVANSGEVIGLYERLLKGESLPDQAANLAYAQLKLAGLARRDEQGRLTPRNRLYQRLFNLEWVKASKPKKALTRARRLAYGAVASLFLAIAAGGIYYQTTVVPLQSQQEARQQLENLQVTLERGGDYTVVGLPAQERGKVFRRALPALQTLSTGRESSRLAFTLEPGDDIALEELAAWTGLARLALRDPNVSDLSPLADMTGLRELDVSNTAVRDLTPLANLTQLEVLHLSRTRVTDLSPLKGLPALRYLSLDGLGLRGFIPAHPDATVLEDPPPLAGKPRPGAVFRDCPACPQMVSLPAGRFLMGSPAIEVGRDDNEGPQHLVSIPPIAVARYETRFDEWELCVQEGACPALDDAGFGRGARPALQVSWEEAQAYVKWLAKRSGQAYRLLGEAEWEYAARAGTKTARYWGDDPDQACVNGNVWDEAGKRGASIDLPWQPHNCSDGHAFTAPAGIYQPNAFGLYDMIGNVWEWTEDCYHDSYQNAPQDGRPWTKGICKERVVRGGGWIYFPADARSADRGRGTPGGRSLDLGFRVARTLSP